MDEMSHHSIQVVTYEDPHLTRGVSDLITATIDVGQLQEKFRAFLTSLQKVVDWDREHIGGFQLDKIEFSIEITAEGDFKLLGVGTSIGTTGAIKFVMKRQEQE